MRRKFLDGPLGHLAYTINFEHVDTSLGIPSPDFEAPSADCFIMTWVGSVESGRLS